MNIVLWHRPVIEGSAADRAKAQAAAEQFCRDVAPTLPRGYKDKEGRVIGQVVRVWAVDGVAAMMVAGRVELGG